MGEVNEMSTGAPAPTEGEKGKEEVQGNKNQTGTGSATQGTGSSRGDLVKEAAQEAIRKHKVKVDGEELEIDEEELKRGYSHQKKASRLMQEAITTKKQAEQFVSMMKDKQKLFDAIQKLGHDPDELVSEYLKSTIRKKPNLRKSVEEIFGGEVKYELMDEKDRRLLELEEKTKSFEEIEKKRLEEIEARRQEELKAKYIKEFNETFVESLKNSKLPQNKEMIARMASYIGQAAKQGFKMTTDEAAQLVKDDIENIHRSVISESDGDTLLRLLGDETAAKILEARGKKIKTPESELKTPETQSERERRAKGRRMSHREWREFNRR